MKHILPNCLIIFIFLLTFSCKQKDIYETKIERNKCIFNENNLLLTEKEHTKKIKGQLLYMPVYSNVPYFEPDRRLDLSAFIAIHNTDLQYQIKVTKVLYFNNSGNLVANYLMKDTVINPLGAADFFVPERDKSGTGANFLIEWISDSLVNEPLVETIMLGLSSGQGVSFSSKGKIIRERN